MEMFKDATLSIDRKYRYVLERRWDVGKKTVCFIGVNPSTANEKEDDPTIRRCIKFAESWGYGGIFMVNLFGLRATNPKELESHNDPIGQNDSYVKISSKKSDITILAWGNKAKFPKGFENRDKEIIRLVRNPYCLKKTKSGCPGHPLYLKSNLKPIKWDS